MFFNLVACLGLLISNAAAGNCPTQLELAIHNDQSVTSLSFDIIKTKAAPFGCSSDELASNLQTLRIFGNPELTSLPAGVFNGLTGLTTLAINNNPKLTSLPAGVFNGLTGLTTLGINSNPELTSLPAGVFNGLTGLTTLEIYNNLKLTSLPAGLLNGLTGLTTLTIIKSLTSLPAGVFNGLTGLTYLSIMYNPGLTSLPAGVFNGLTGLTTLGISPELECTTSERDTSACGVVLDADWDNEDGCDYEGMYSGWDDEQVADCKDPHTYFRLVRVCGSDDTPPCPGTDSCDLAAQQACAGLNQKVCSPGSTTCGDCMNGYEAGDTTADACAPTFTGDVCGNDMGGYGCDCPLNTDPMQGAKASTIVKGTGETRVEGGKLYLHIEQSPMLLKTEMKLGLDINKEVEAEVIMSDACSELFDWSLSTEDNCSKNIYVGEASFADVLAKCNPDEDKKSDGNDLVNELTFHFNVDNKRMVQIAGTWQEQVTKTYMPVRVSLQKTFATSTTTITVEEIVQRFLRIELTFAADYIPAVDDTELITALIEDFGAELTADTGAAAYEENNVNVNKINNTVVLRILLLPEDDEDGLEAVVMTKLLAKFGDDAPSTPDKKTKEVITSVIAPSGVMEVATARTGVGGKPELNLLLYAQAGYPYVLKVAEAAEYAAKYPTYINSDAGWQVRTPLDDCDDSTDACGTYYTLTANDPDLLAGSFTGVYKVVLEVSCTAGFATDKCAVFSRGSTVSLLFTIETGNHMPQVLGPVTFTGSLRTTALGYGENQEMKAFLNDEILYTVATVTSAQAQLTEAVVILASLEGTTKGSVILYNAGVKTPSGFGVGFATVGDSEATDAGGKLFPKFQFKTNMTVLNELNKDADGIGNGAAGFTVSVTLRVKYAGLDVPNRRLLTTTRRLLAPANEVVAASQRSVTLTSAPLSAADPVKKTDDGISAGASVLPGSGVLALLVAMVCVALH